MTRTDSFSPLAERVFKSRYSKDGVETWSQTAERVSMNVLGAAHYLPHSPVVKQTADIISSREFLPGGRYLASSGREYHQVQNCLLLRAEDTVESWGDLLDKVAVALMRGAGVGVDYSALRGRGSEVRRTGHKAGGPCALMQAVNEVGRQMKEGERLAAIWAGLIWSHPDIMTFLQLKDWSPELRALKAQDSSIPMRMEYTNVSVILDDEFFTAYHDAHHPLHDHAHFVYWSAVKKMLKTGEPGFSINVGKNAGESLRNACTEITSADSNDVCNLGSINLGRLDDINHFRYLVSAGTRFLLAGTLYSDLPYPEVHEIRDKNRRLGLGLMGIHEWLLKRGYSYRPNLELGKWLEVYTESTSMAHSLAEQWRISAPLKTRAIAPNGTIGLLAETTTGIEPITCVAQVRRWNDRGSWQSEYVVDPTASRLIEAGVSPDEIEDAYSIGFRERLEFQAWVQKYVDHGISSTVNISSPITDKTQVRAYGNILMDYLPQLRGVTVYPDGARTGQPITPVKYEEAVDPEIWADENGSCATGVCAI